MRSSPQKGGLSVVEIVIAAAIIITVVTAAGGAWQLYLRLSNTSIRQSQAAILTEEAAEALRVLRDENWTRNIATLTNGTLYQLSWNGGRYSLDTSQVLLQNQYVRTIALSAVNRDATTFDIVSSGGTTDTNTKKVTISVFTEGATSSPIMQSEMLLHNVQNN